MNEGLIPRRYAKALYATACERGVDTKVYDLMNILERNFAALPSMQQVMANPYVSDADKIGLLSSALAIENSDSVVCNFFKLLAQNKRLDMAYACALAYIDIYRKQHSIHKVVVVSAAKMSAEDDKRLRALIERHLNGGTMEYSASVDPSLIGGFTVSVGNERLDASISNELKQLRLNLLSK
ncbi:MAG: ATP synthase F1 subunit delta [Paramuribaculum sp.]|nr:ATP synthase F1 subunit delta [Paramuribaculum sp.]